MWDKDREFLTLWCKLERDKHWWRITPLDIRKALSVGTKCTHSARSGGHRGEIRRLHLSLKSRKSHSWTAVSSMGTSYPPPRISAGLGRRGEYCFLSFPPLFPSFISLKKDSAVVTFEVKTHKLLRHCFSSNPWTNINSFIISLPPENWESRAQTEAGMFQFHL